MPDETKHGLTYLTDPNIRLSAGIAPGNEYIFASQGMISNNNLKKKQVQSKKVYQLRE